MGRTSSPLAAACAAFAAFGAAAQSTPQLLDLAARVHYGFYHGDARAIDAAAAALERLGESPETLYYGDFAALRRAQLGHADRATLARLRECAARVAANGLSKARAAEAWVLAAACALVAGEQRGSEQALANARALDADNPRIGLVESWALKRAAGSDPARREALAAKLAAVVDGFEDWTASIDDPDWGHAEALTALAASALERGQVRAARDLIERALLIVPDYRAAVALRGSLQNARTGNRSL